MKRFLTIAIFALAVSAGAQENERPTILDRLDKVEKGVHLAKETVGFFSGESAADEALAYQQMSQEAQQQHHATLRAINHHSWIEIVSKMAVVGIVGLCLCGLLFGMLGIEKVRSGLSAGYRHTQLTRQIIHTYEDDLGKGQFSLTSDRAILIGLSNIGWGLFGGLALLAIISLFGTILTISASLFW